MSANQLALWYLVAAVSFILALSLNAKTGDFNVPKDDEIIQATLVCENGQVVVAKK